MAVAALLFISVGIIAPLHGAIIFTDVPDVNLMAGGFGGEASYDVDFNADGVSDLNVFSRFGDFGARTLNSSRVVGIPNRPPDSSGDAHPFIFGELISISPPSSRAWFSGVAGFLGCQEIGCIGLWTSGGTNYVGTEFQIGSGTHYGWVAIEMQAIFGGGHLLSYAYESEPNRSVVAGAIPEPGTAILVGTGSALLWARNVKTRKENKALQRTARGIFVSTLSFIRKCLGFGGAPPAPSCR